ncbi:hypothetical protein [Geminicoccus harenae]|uniref:hypothetical protein n=1 Tax=Geminicoccus harenae TaxID=2498453 RepID=UPI00168BA79E|nr:hypothetical protein [Geminicoccus harenae]
MKVFYRLVVLARMPVLFISLLGPAHAADAGTCYVIGDGLAQVPPDGDYLREGNVGRERQGLPPGVP